MSFLLKSPRLTTSLVGFARQAEFSLRKSKILSCIRQPYFRVRKTFVRSYALAPQSYASPADSQNTKETLYQKSISQVCFDVRFKGYTFREDINDAWHSLKFTAAFTVDQTVMLIRSCGHSLPQEKPSEKLKLVKEIWDSFDDMGISKTIYHYNALLDVYNDLEHSFCPLNFLSSLEKQGLTPTLATYKKLLDALSIQGNIGKSQNILEHMKMNSVTINDGVFNSLILGHSLQGDFLSAQGILELMKEKGLMVTSESYVSLALGYAKLGDFDKVKEIVKECKEQRIMLSTTQFLEIAYTFALNKHSEHFSATLAMITLTKDFPTISTKIIHRLLHQNLDKEAFTLLEIRNKLESISKNQEPLQMFIDHYIRFRKPDEVFNMVEVYQEKGWSPIALAYCLKETLIRKDVSCCLNFLQTLKTRGYPLRIHYFYPILLKTHRTGNDEVLKLLRQMTQYHVSFNREALRAFHKFYDFVPGSEFEDLEKIKDTGVSQRLIAWKILDILLYRKNVTDAVKLVSTYKIAYPAILLPSSMAVAFSTKEADHEKFVYILSHLIHNIKANKIIRRQNSTVSPAEYEQFMIEIAKACDKTFNLRVMEEMLKKKIPVTPSVGVFISKTFSSPEVSDLVAKLTSANLKLEFDENLLQRLLKVKGPKKLEFSGGKSDWSELDEVIKKNEDVPIVMNIFEKLAQKTDPEDKTQENVVKELFKYVSLKGDIASTERIYKVGIQNRFFKEENYSPCVMAHIVSGNLNDAARRFYEGLKATTKARGLEVLIREIKKSKNHLALNDIKVSINSVWGEYLGTAELFKTFVKVGFVEEVTKILQSKGQTLKPLFSELCGELYKEKNVKYLEHMERAARTVPEFNFTFVYYQLLNLYVRNGSLEKVLKLYVDLVREDIMKGHFQKILFYHLKNWPHDVPEKLKKVFECVLADCDTKKATKPTETVFYEENVQDVSTEEVQPSSESENESVSNLSKEDILECYCLIQAGKLDEYFKILRKKIVQGGPEEMKKYLFCYKLVPYLITNPKYFEEYKKIVSLGKYPFFWKKYLKLCISMGNVPETKKAMNKLSPKQLKSCIKDISFVDCLRLIQSADSHEILGKKIAHFYSKVIETCSKENQFEMAKKYLEMAKKNKVEYLLNSSYVIE